jgi:hypothetical protein
VLCYLSTDAPEALAESVVLRVAYCSPVALLGVDISPRLWQATILAVDFVVCTLAVKKKIRAGFDMSDQSIPLLDLYLGGSHFYSFLGH